ncbi:MAG: COG2426 family protein [Christensenellales bacterium]|jgi:uncharacterized membrane protein|nr:small multi-drug export protein [Clostridiales bacterium]
MGEIIEKIIVGLQQALKNDYLVTFIISMIPAIEVRGSIPVALQMGMKPVTAYFFSCVSSLVVAPILMFSFQPLLNALKRTKVFKKIARSFEDMYKDKAEKISQKAEIKVEEAKKNQKKLEFYKTLGLFVFVAIPLPMTGVWTGSIVSVFLNLDWKKSLLALVLGNFVAGAIIITASLLLGEKSYIIIMVLLVFVLISIIAAIVSFYMKSRKNKKSVVYTDKDTKGQ